MWHINIKYSKSTSSFFFKKNTAFFLFFYLSMSLFLLCCVPIYLRSLSYLWHLTYDHQDLISVSSSLSLRCLSLFSATSCSLPSLNFDSSPWIFQRHWWQQHAQIWRDWRSKTMVVRKLLSLLSKFSLSSLCQRFSYLFGLWRWWWTEGRFVVLMWGQCATISVTRCEGNDNGGGDGGSWREVRTEI